MLAWARLPVQYSLSIAWSVQGVKIEACYTHTHTHRCSVSMTVSNYWITDYGCNHYCVYVPYRVNWAPKKCLIEELFFNEGDIVPGDSRVCELDEIDDDK